MSTATAVWSPLCAPTDLARQRSRSDAVGGGDSMSTRNVGLPGRSEGLLYHTGRRSCGENQRENFCSTQDKVMDRLCGQLDELLKRVGAVGPSPFILRPQRDGVTQFNTSSVENRAVSDRADEHLSRGSAGFGAAQPPTWTPKGEVLDTRSHNAGNGRRRGGEWPAADAVQRRRESPEVDHFFKTKICPFIKGGGICLRNSACTFAHSVDELRPQPSFRKTKLCRYSNAGQVCSRGENCSFAHSVRELKPLQVPPFRRKHQSMPFRSSFASPAAQPTSTYPTAATAHSQAAASGGTAPARTLPAPAAAEPGQDSQILGSASSAAHGGIWQESRSSTGRDGTAHNSGSSTGSSLYDAQQRLLYSDLRHLSEARLGSLLASVHEKGKGSPLSAAGPTAVRAAQKQHPNASQRQLGEETYLSSPSDCHALQRYLHPRNITQPTSSASPMGHAFPRVSPSAPECPLEPRQQARRLQQLEGVVTRIACAQRSAGDQLPAAHGVLEPSLHQPNREEQRRVRFVADDDVHEQQPKASTAYLSRKEQPTFPVAPARPAAPGCSQPEEQQHLVAAAAAAELRHCEDRSWLTEASLAVSELWHNRCRSPPAGVCNNSSAQTPESSPVSLTVEADSFCHHLAGGRAVKKSRRGKRGGRKKRGTGHPAGGSSAEQHEQLYTEQQQHQEGATGEERTADDCSSYADKASKGSSTWGRPDPFFFGEVDTPDAMKSLPQRGEGSAASTCFSEGTPSTGAVGERCSASRVFSAGTAEGDTFLHFLDPGQKEGATPPGGVDGQDSEEKDSAQLLLEALHAQVAAVGDSAAGACDLEIAAPSLLLSAAPATATLSLSSLSNAKTLCSGKDSPGEEKKQAMSAFFSKEDTESVLFGDEVRQMETPQEVLTKLLQGEETQQLLLQCIRDIVHQTPHTSSPSDILSTLQLLSTSFGGKTVVADIPAAADAADEAAKKREMHAAAAGRQEGEDGVIEKGCFIQEKIWPSDNSKCPVLPAQGRKCMFSPIVDFNFGLSEKEKAGLNERRTAAADLAPGASAGAAVASILELLTDEDEGTKTGSAVGQQQASTRYSSRCGLSQEEAGGLLFGELATEAGNPVIRSSVGGNRVGAISAPGSGEYVSGFFTPSFPVDATSTTSLSPWV